MLQNLSQHIPQLEKLLTNIETIAQNSVEYNSAPNIFDVDLPLICAYLTYWWQFGPEANRNLWVYKLYFYFFSEFNQ